MKIPGKRTAAYAVARLIHADGQMTVDACVEALPDLGARTVREAMRDMLADGLIEEAGGLCSLRPKLREYFDLTETKEAGAAAVAEKTPPPYHPQMKPWSGKYSLSVAARRNDAPPPREPRFHFSGTESDPLKR